MSVRVGNSPMLSLYAGTSTARRPRAFRSGPIEDCGRANPTAATISRQSTVTRVRRTLAIATRRQAAKITIREPIPEQLHLNRAEYSIFYVRYIINCVSSAKLSVQHLGKGDSVNRSLRLVKST